MTPPAAPEASAGGLGIVGPGGFWFFAYGSLMWSPPFRPAESVPARLHGWRRSFCVGSETYRGTPARPGLTLGLDRGGSCAGLALRIAAAGRDAAVAAIAAREMEDDPPAYACRRVLLALPGRRVAGYALVADRTAPVYAGGLSFEETARRIAAAAGSRGSNAAYLDGTVAALERAGIAPGRLLALRRRVAELGGARPMAIRAGNG